MMPESPLSRTVDEILRDAGETDPGLRAALLSLGALASTPAPRPAGALAALLAAETSQLAGRRERRRRRAAAVGLTVIAGMGLGITGVAAAASAPGLNASPSIQHLLQHWAPSWGIPGSPAADPAKDSLPEVAVAGPGSPDGSAAGPGTVEVGTVDGATGTPRADPPASASRNGGAAGNGAAASPDKPAQDGTSAGMPANVDPAAELDNAGQPRAGQPRAGQPKPGQPKAGKSPAEAPAVVNSVAPALAAPAAAAEETGAGIAGPGSSWVKKLRR